MLNYSVVQKLRLLGNVECLRQQLKAVMSPK